MACPPWGGGVQGRWVGVAGPRGLPCVSYKQFTKVSYLCVPARQEKGDASLFSGGGGGGGKHAQVFTVSTLASS